MSAHACGRVNNLTTPSYRLSEKLTTCKNGGVCVATYARVCRCSYMYTGTLCESTYSTPITAYTMAWH